MSKRKFIDESLRGTGPVAAYRNLGKKTPQVPKEVIWSDLCDLVRSMPMNDAEIHEMYKILRNRLPHAFCTSCGDYAMKLDGALLPALDGDLSKPKRFVCEKCKEKK